MQRMFATLVPALLAAWIATVGTGREPNFPQHTHEETSMDTTVEASFEITGWEETDLVDGEVRVYRTDVTKRFSGGLEGTSEAPLIMTTTPSGPAAYG